ncbi:hypothetical protein D9615_007524 [Tricholomella constricta]|uniref:PHD-type domain-containing protein n=1 Tax=Tricholomella constricta TaxID=117010 RepID=A0A8H5H7C2_9AGAR|nr:hypothetical protein D9615_007524 [Tricholomella constricta]
MADFFTVEKTAAFAGQTCWRTINGNRLCSGNRQDLKNLIVSIPISFRVEIEDDYRQNSEVEQQLWNFPASFSPHISSTTEDCGIIYDLVGLALVNRAEDHFIARYSSKDQQVIYTYDGMKNGGFSIQEPGALFSTHLAGKNVSLPDGYDTHQAFYHLRGGLKAQAEFYRLQTDTYREKFDLAFFPRILVSSFSVTYTGKDMQPMNKEDRFWMQKPTHCPTTEYLSTKLADTMDSASDSAESEEETRQSARHKGQKTAVSFYAPIHQIPSSPSRLPSTPPAIATSELSSLSSLKSSTSSLPNSEFCIDCRCGLAGDGNIFYNGAEGRAIQCDECRDWSHVACQKNGRAGNLRENEPFICDKCTITPFLLPTRVSKRKKTISHPLKDRLREGCGALACQGEFWYPVRLIQPQEGGSRWQVRWWRGCDFEMNVADSFSVVEQRDIVDSLWIDRTERRKIRLGKWLHGWEVQTSEDVLADPSSMPYTDKVEKVLSTFKDVLWTLLTTPERVSSLKVPAKGWLESQKKNLTKTMIPYVGSLSIVERAQISNWFEAHISKDPKLRKHWLGVPSVWTDVDVDRECLDLLEEQMFEISSQAGIAGHYQWGKMFNGHTSSRNSPRSKFPTSSSFTSSFTSFPSVISVRSLAFTEAVNNLKTSSTPLPRLTETATALISTLAAHERKNTFEYNGFRLELHAVLQAMLDNAESCGGQASKRYTASAICRCAILDDPDPDNVKTLHMLRELAITWVTHLLFVFCNAATCMSQMDKPYPDTGRITPRRGNTFIEQLLQREENRCLVLGIVDRAVDGRRSRVDLHGCHIINLPRAIAISVPDSQQEGDQDVDHSSAMTTFDIFQNYTNLSREAIRGLEDDDFNDPSNGILLQFDARYGFRHYQWCLQETEVPGRYRIRVYGCVHGLKNLDVNNIFVEVKDHSEEILQRVLDKVKCKRRREVPLPSPRYLRIHATIARVLYTSGAGSFLDELLMKYEHEMDYLTDDGGVVRSWEEFERLVETANLREKLVDVYELGLGEDH